MDGVLHGYQITDTTWFYHSLLLILAVFFRFNRVFSIRNFDLFLLLSLSPLLLLKEMELAELRSPVLVTYVCVLSGALVFRLVFDGLFQRRPKLQQNLNVQGLTFLCLAAFAFLMTNVMTKAVPLDSQKTVQQGTNIVQRVDASQTSDDPAEGTDAGPVPASAILSATVKPLSKAVAGNDDHRTQDLTARITAIIAHTAVVAGLILVGVRHFGDLQIGVAMATIYLLLPCTAFNVHEVNHVLPAAFVIWAVVAYRKPMVSGAMLGLASGTIFFTVFLAPIWAVFYGRKGGGVRFMGALVTVSGILMAVLIRTSVDPLSLQQQLIGHIKWDALQFVGNLDAPDGLPNNFRIPIFAFFIVLLCLLTIWPKKKNLEHLIAHSTAIIVATQLWYPQQTGMYVLWYLPLLLLVVFRPRLNRLLPPAVEAREADSRLPRPTIVGASQRSASRSGIFR